MKTLSTHFWAIRVLVVLLVIILSQCNVELINYMRNTEWISIIRNSGPLEIAQYLFVALFCLFYVTFLYVVTVVLATYLLGSQGDFIYLPKNINKLQKQIRRYFGTFAPHNQYITLSSVCVTISAGFLINTIGYILLAQVYLLISISLLPLHYRGSICTCILLIACILLLNVRITSFQNYDLLHQNVALLIALGISTCLVGIWYAMQRNLFLNERLLKALLCFTAIIVLTFIPYNMLVTLNCHYSRSRTIINITGKIVQKCSYEDKKFEVHFRYNSPTGTNYAQMPVHPYLYHTVQIGQTLQLHLHDGLLGWAWYHDSISQRLIRSIPKEKIIEEE